MPWLAATALIHSVTVLATRDGLRAWTIMLAVLAFSMSMVGTFLVRSGILTSVHSASPSIRERGHVHSRAAGGLHRRRPDAVCAAASAPSAKAPALIRPAARRRW